EIAGSASVTILEAEAQPGYHSTGRSAAFWSESYGGPMIRPLTTASGPLLAPWLRPRGAVHIADAQGRGALEKLSADFPDLFDAMDRPALEGAIPGLRPGWDHGLAEPSCAEIDVALAIDRFEDAVDWRVQAVERKWAGLRSFAPDRLPVYGFAEPGFFWCAGQGGFGIQTAPAAARLAAALLLGRTPEIDPAP